MILAKIAPGATPKKRKAPDGAADGLIPAVDGPTPRLTPGSPPKPAKAAASGKNRAATGAAAAVVSSSTHSDDSSSASGHGAGAVGLDQPAALASMPPDRSALIRYGPGAALDRKHALVAARCARRWLPTSLRVTCPRNCAPPSLAGQEPVRQGARGVRREMTTSRNGRGQREGAVSWLAG